MTKTKRLVLAALCIALALALPPALHSIPNAGNILLPMHIPVLLCGLLCGPWYGIACGVLATLLSHLITGMPVAAFLPSMLCELAVYGLAAGLLTRCVKTKSRAANIYISLIGAMLIGRVVYGLTNAFIFRAGAYSVQLWLTGVFITSLPGIIIQLIAIPAVIMVLQKSHLIEAG